jgi:PIN domain nuclease of toxin-antitoxin system
MECLLDTQVVLWSFMRSKLLGRKARSIIANLENTIYVSSVSVWEIAIKSSIGKLELPGDPGPYLEQRMRNLGYNELTIAHRHAIAVRNLSPHHKDPFDRLLIAQAQLEGLHLVTSDAAFRDYDVHLIDALK